jgi:CRISPR system Cascade subunit CasE
MTYLSQVWVNRDEAAKRRFSDTYAWHQALWAAFPDKDGEPRQFLFRVDDQHARFRVLLMSPDQPVSPGWGAWETKKVAASFLSHGRYRFQLRANPTVKRVVRDANGAKKKNGQRTGIYDEAGLRAWLDRKAEQAGFAVEDCVVAPPMDSYFVNTQRKRGKHISVDFQGFLRVVDQPAFERAFHRGIGPAKGFGFGMLMLQPVA